MRNVIKKLNKLLKLNEYFFYFIYSLTLFFFFLEAITYEGFFQKHFSIPLKFLLYLTLICGAGALFINQKKPFVGLMRKIYYKSHIVLTPIAILFWLSITLLESLNYENYVFTRLHITPSYFLPVVFLTVFFLIVAKVKSARVKIDFNFRHKTYAFVVYIFFALFVYQNMQIFPYAINELKWIIKYPRASNEEKISFKWGKDFYSYVKFIEANTPENAKILLPPREDPWGLEGNDHVMRAFLYPRKVIRHYEGLDLNREKIDFILITSGFSILEHKQFPNFNVEADKIIIFEPKTGKTTVINSGVYNHEAIIYDKAHGLIILNKR